MRDIGKIRRGVFGAAVLSALGFGVSGVLATPAEASGPYCVPRECRENCIADGAPGGSCNTMDDSCNCYW